ncbi:hypothetical protein BDV96DRAFT_273947 [Lophiotrema nucula]|uniref:TATA element modulatory factor 1 TATA binding domain-containing protein n=1 Tax=Lophiotrema nucula TaxID=690887 RepID=A0A6A5ZPB4_9PLEO|nr:hypothetical protein BDV96DRAFT_273947 [Lophiotrema nucula]
MAGQQKSRWGSLLSGAVAGLESNLDKLLAEDNQASAKSRAAETAAKQEAAETEKQRLQVESASRNSSRSRPSSRLQDRLAKAVNKGNERPRANSGASTDAPSRPESPALRSPGVVSDIGRASIDSKVSDVTSGTVEAGEGDSAKSDDTQVEPAARPSTDIAPTSPPTSVVAEQPASMPLPSMSIPSILTPDTISPRQSIDSVPSRPSIDLSTPADLEVPTSRSPATVDVELSTLKKTHEETLRDHRAELHSHLERIDALQSKLTYLSQQLASSAKAASSSDDSTPADKKLAEKDAQIAALMEEGQKLSKVEMKHLTTIKKMRTKGQETDREITLLKQRLLKAEKSISEQTERAKRAEAAEKAAQDKLKVVAKIEKDIELIRSEREEAQLTIQELRRQLSDALSKAADAEKRVQAGALEAEKRVTASLKDDIENIRIEKKLSEDRAKRELQDAREDASRQHERAKVAELELRGEIAVSTSTNRLCLHIPSTNEIQNLETKLELLRSRSEEVSSSATGDSQAKLLRQVETLQTQYALASENWQGIESTLTNRVAALEKDRDETAKRESDIRRKARDVNSKARRLEDELEGINDRARTLEHDLTEQQNQAQKLQARLTHAETAARDAHADLEKEKKVWEAEFQQRIEEEKNKWRVEMQALSSDSNYLRTESPGASLRKHSPDYLAMHGRRAMPRSISTAEIPLSPMDFENRRPSSARTKSGFTTRTPEMGTPYRQDSIPSSLSNLNGNQTPSIHTYDHDEAFENTSSPHRNAWGEERKSG